MYRSRSKCIFLNIYTLYNIKKSIDISKDVLSKYSNRISLYNGNYKDFDKILEINSIIIIILNINCIRTAIKSQWNINRFRLWISSNI